MDNFLHKVVPMQGKSLLNWRKSENVKMRAIWDAVGGREFYFCRSQSTQNQNLTTNFPVLCWSSDVIIVNNNNR